MGGKRSPSPDLSISLSSGSDLDEGKNRYDKSTHIPPPPPPSFMGRSRGPPLPPLDIHYRLGPAGGKRRRPRSPFREDTYPPIPMHFEERNHRTFKRFEERNQHIPKRFEEENQHMLQHFEERNQHMPMRFDNGNQHMPKYFDGGNQHMSECFEEGNEHMSKHFEEGNQHMSKRNRSFSQLEAPSSVQFKEVKRKVHRRPRNSTKEEFFSEPQVHVNEEVSKVPTHRRRSPPLNVENIQIKPDTTDTNINNRHRKHRRKSSKHESRKIEKTYQEKSKKKFSQKQKYGCSKSPEEKHEESDKELKRDRHRHKQQFEKHRKKRQKEKHGHSRKRRKSDSSDSKQDRHKETKFAEKHIKSLPKTANTKVRKEPVLDKSPDSDSSSSSCSSPVSTKSPSIKKDMNRQQNDHERRDIAPVVNPEPPEEKEEEEEKNDIESNGTGKWGQDETEQKPQLSNEEITDVKPSVNMGLSGKLTEDANTYNGVVIKYSQPPEARKPKRRWRWYIFKGDQELPFLPLHRQSAYLIGRDRKVADIPTDHPSCSKQHSVLQYRLVTYEKTDGSQGRTVKPYIIDLDSANGTYVNNRRIDPRRYVELLEKDVVKFGYSSREYVLLHEASKGDEGDLPPPPQLDLSPVSLLRML